MIHTQRPQTHHHRARSPPLISRPAAAESYAPITPPTSPPTSPPRGRRPSVSGAMSWLTRTASNTPYAPSKPIRISEPKFAMSLESLTSTRSGVLGRGATVVRTPQEALAGSNASYVDLGSSSHGSASGSAYGDHDGAEDEAEEDDDARSFAPRPESPPLPPIPDAERSNNRISQVSSVRSPPRPTRSPPAAPDETGDESTTPRSSPKSVSPSRSLLESFPPVPSLPEHVQVQSPVAPFEPVLMTPPPGAINMKDAAKVLVTLETSTMTHRTTLKTLTAHPSHLATYLKSLIPTNLRDSDVESIYSHVSDDAPFNSIFHQHLTAGLLGQSTTMHIFLDRPSEPYANVLSYLRAPLATPESPAVLPRAVQLTSNSSSRLEALLDLRDEARFLGLEELEKLCNDELRQRQSTSSLGLGLHMRGFSNASGLSARSLHTLREGGERPVLHRRESSTNIVSRSPGKSDILHAHAGLQQQRTPPRERSRPRIDGAATMRSRPTGEWI